MTDLFCIYASNHYHLDDSGNVRLRRMVATKKNLFSSFT